MENSKYGSRSLVNLKLIRICISKWIQLVYAIPNYRKKHTGNILTKCILFKLSP